VELAQRNFVSINIESTNLQREPFCRAILNDSAKRHSKHNADGQQTFVAWDASKCAP
jgi:hypothetical protein